MDEKVKSENPEVEELTVRAYDWKVVDKSTDDGRAAILAWCLDRDSNSHLLRINDFPAFCYIELPVAIGNRPIVWRDHWKKIETWLEGRLEEEEAPLSVELVYRSKLYYYQDRVVNTDEGYKSDTKKWPMVLVTFKSLQAMDKCEKLLGRPIRVPELGTLVCRVWETKIPLERKLLSVRNCAYSQWFNVKAVKVDESDKISTLEREWNIDWATLTPLDSKLTSGWATYPGILAFDIECYSDNHKAMPNELISPDVVYMISALYQKSGNKDSLQRYLIIMGECQEIPGTTVIKVQDEVALCHALCDLIKELDPVIITGYNIIGFDYKYLDARLKRQIESWTNCSRLRHKKVELKPLSWSSSAYGQQDLYILELDGRISVDMLPLVRREYKLPKYDLNTVSFEFLKRGKHDVKPIEMFRIYRELRDSPNDPAAIEKMTKVAKYCVEDAELALDLFEKLNTWIGLVELSSIMGVRVVDLFTRGQQIRCLSQIYHLASQMGIVLDKRFSAEETFGGAFVFEPEAGVYDFVICLDFKSLYPSIIIAFNICYTTLVPPEMYNRIPDEMCNIIECVEDENTEKAEYEVDGDLADKVTRINLDDDDEEDPEGEGPKVEKKPKKVYRYKFIKAIYKKGLLPILVGVLVDSRTDVRKEQKKFQEGTIDHTVLEKRQNALKTAANSVFGFTGVRNGKLALMEAARSITAKGRELITFCNEYLKAKHLAKIIYNDSVAEDTPILVRGFGKVKYVRIGELVKFTSNEKDRRHDGKEEIVPSGVEVWSDKGWTKIKRVIRHLTTKTMYQVSTRTGLVKVTEDHSLLLPDGTPVQPGALYTDPGILFEEGGRLLHAALPTRRDTTSLLGGGIKTMNHVDAANYYWMARSMGLSVRVSCTRKYVKCEVVNSIVNADYVNTIIPLGKCTGYVYDLETENHHFSAGVGELVVHNTDSTMFTLPAVTCNREALEWGKKLEKEISAQFPRPLYTEFEKAGRMFSIKKKKYAFWTIDPETNCLKESESYWVQSPECKRIKLTDVISPGKMNEKEYLKSLKKREIVPVDQNETVIGDRRPFGSLFKNPQDVVRIKREETVHIWDPELGRSLTVIKVVIPSVLMRGITLARRDNCYWQRAVYNKILDEVLERAPMMTTFFMVVESCLEMKQHQIPPSNLVIIRGLGAVYKSDSYFMKIFSDELQKIGRPAAAGDRLDYVIVKNRNPLPEGTKELLGHKMRLFDYYMEQGEGEREPIDDDYYLEKVIKNCIEQLFQLGYRQEIAELSTQYSRSDYERLFEHMKSQGYGEAVEFVREEKNNNYEEMVERLLNVKGLKTKMLKWRSFYINRFRRLNTRVGKFPIKMMIKLFETKGDYLEELRRVTVVRKYGATFLIRSMNRYVGARILYQNQFLQKLEKLEALAAKRAPYIVAMQYVLDELRSKVEVVE